MLPRLASLSRTAFVAGRIRAVQPVRMMSAEKPQYEVAIEQKTNLDVLPVPEGSWQEYHSAQVGKWNMMLGASIIIFAATCWGMYASGAAYMNVYPNLKKIKIDPKAVNPLGKFD